MLKNYLSISIPEELTQYQKGYYPQEEILSESFVSEVEVIKNQKGQIECVNYYQEEELIEQVVYNGFTIVAVNYYRENKLHLRIDIANNNVINKTYYRKNGSIYAEISFEYNKQNKITSIEKVKNNDVYYVKYGYDELDRVNSRKIFINSELVREQKYRYDILDRIVEYRDENQRIVVNNISNKNELISYTITDKIGNEISVINNFSEQEYTSTNLLLNGHTTHLKDESYVDNVMLKKPYTTESDLDLIIQNLLKPNDCVTKRTNLNSVNLIDKNIEVKILPISIRKRILYNIATKA